jgi:4,5-dihydroxyphthalate decarboxylase
MNRLQLSLAIGDYDRTRPLIDGEVGIDGVAPIIMRLSPEEIFFRAFRHAAFDICELSLSSFTVKTAIGDSAYVGVPAFLSRAFRHTSIVVRTDRIKRPEDLKGRTIGVSEYQLTANVWARALLSRDFGVWPSDVCWVRGGLEDSGRIEKIAITLPADVHLEDAPPGRTLSEMLADGTIDAIIAPRLPSCFERRLPNIGWLFSDPSVAAEEYYRRTRIFPIMHLVGVRRAVVEVHPWLPATVLKAFEQAKMRAIARLSDTSATKVTMPFVEEQLERARDLIGRDYWPYGVAANRHVLEAFLAHHHEQGLSRRQVLVEELFHPSTLEVFHI